MIPGKFHRLSILYSDSFPAASSILFLQKQKGRTSLSMRAHISKHKTEQAHHQRPHFFIVRRKKISPNSALDPMTKVMSLSQDQFTQVQSAQIWHTNLSNIQNSQHSFIKPKRGPYTSDEFLPQVVLNKNGKRNRNFFDQQISQNIL